jgi:hypothetical protein
MNAAPVPVPDRLKRGLDVHQLTSRHDSQTTAIRP